MLPLPIGFPINLNLPYGLVLIPLTLHGDGEPLPALRRLNLVSVLIATTLHWHRIEINKHVRPCDLVKQAQTGEILGLMSGEDHLTIQFPLSSLSKLKYHLIALRPK